MLGWERVFTLRYAHVIPFTAYQLYFGFLMLMRKQTSRSLTVGISHSHAVTEYSLVGKPLILAQYLLMVHHYGMPASNALIRGF